MGRPAGWMHKLTWRGAMRSPGAPPHRREIERLFLEQIATGITSERAADVVGVSQAVGTRRFGYRGGQPLFRSNPISGRYLSFAEREEIGLLLLQGVGVHEIARRIGLRGFVATRPCGERFSVFSTNKMPVSAARFGTGLRPGY